MKVHTVPTPTNVHDLKTLNSRC